MRKAGNKRKWRTAPLLAARADGRRGLTRIGWPGLLIVLAAVTVAAIALMHEESPLAALERPAQHAWANFKQVQDAPSMPLILRFDLRP